MIIKKQFDITYWVLNTEQEVFTRDGREVFELKHFITVEEGPCLFGVVDGYVKSWYIDGLFKEDEESPEDLFFSLEFQEFDLKKYISMGEPLCYTRDGHVVTQLHIFENVIDESIAGVVGENLYTWHPNGRVCTDPEFIRPLDLMMPCGWGCNDNE